MQRAATYGHDGEEDADDTALPVRKSAPSSRCRRALLSVSLPCPQRSAERRAAAPNLFALPAQILGVRGSVIKSIRSTSGASVEVQRQEDMATSADSREVYLAGKPSCVEQAEQLIWCASPARAAPPLLNWGENPR